MDKEEERGGREIARVAGTRGGGGRGFETSVRNYSVRTTFKYPSSDREISEVAGRAQEDEGRREKTSGWRAEKKKERTRGTAKAEEKEEEKKGRIGYNSTSGSPEISISVVETCPRARVRDTCFAR